MTCTAKAMIRFSIAALFAGGALFWSGELPRDTRSALLSSAEARIGRPLTPMSYAGVARRTTRRAVGVGVYGGAAYGGAYGAAYGAGGVCSQAVDAYGQVVTICR